MAPSFPSAAKIGDSTAEKIDREQLLAYVRDELICTIGSADAPLTIAVLISTFREDTSDDIGQLATKLGYQSIQHMLSANEFSDIIEPCFTDLAKGAGNKNPEKVFCYKVKSRPDIAHILTSIEEGVRYQNKQASEKNRHLQTLLNDPRNAAKIISGKERLLECLHKLGAEEETVPLLKLQKKYEEEYGTQMAKLELKNFFPTGHLKAIMDEYMFDEVDIFTDKNQNGSLLFKLKKPWEDIHQENIRICEQRNRLKKLEEEKEQRRELDKLRKERKAAAKKEKLAKQAVQQQPKKRVIIPPPEPKKKPEPLIRPMRQQASAFYTDDARLMNRVMSARDPRFTDGDDDEAEEEEEAEESYELCEQAEEGEEQVDFDVEDYEDFLLVEKKDNKPKWTQRDWSCTDTEEGEDDGEAGEVGAQKHNAVGTNSGRAVEEQKTQNSSSGQPKKQQEEEEESSEEEEEEDIEEQLKRLQELYGSEKQRNLRIRKAMKKNKRNKMEAELCGRRAREKEMRQQMAEEMLRIFAPNMEGKPTLKVDTKSEDSKLMIAGLLTQFIYGNRELGLSELKDMLQLLFADNYAAVDIDMHAFAKQYMKCARWKELPAEPHLTVKRCAKVLRDKMFHIGKPYRARVMRVHPPNVRVLPSGVRVLAPNPNAVVPKIQHQ